MICSSFVIYVSARQYLPPRAGLPRTILANAANLQILTKTFQGLPSATIRPYLFKSAINHMRVMGLTLPMIGV